MLFGALQPSHRHPWNRHGHCRLPDMGTDELLLVLALAYRGCRECEGVIIVGSIDKGLEPDMFA